ncbi:ROK family transcriptional regulator [Oscillospiraceae bacterium PP1C4]
MPAQKTNSIEVKRVNRNRIYCYLYKKEQLSKQDIAYALKMSLPTVTQNIKELQELGLIEETGTLESTGGRKARAISFKSNARFAIGLDVTKNHISVVLVDLGGNVIENQHFNHPFINRRDYFEEVGRLIRQFVDELHIEHSKILGVGIAVPAIVSEDQQLVTYSPILGFTGGTLKSFAEFIPYPCMLCNDANAAGTAELWSEGEMKDMVYLSLNDTVGGAVLVDGKLCFGKNQRGGALEHMTIVPGGKTCYCGQQGCLDAYCSAHILAESAGGKLENFFANLERGSQRHRKVWDEYLQMLTLATNNLRMIFDCNIILGGHVGSYLDDYIDQLREIAAKRNTFEQDGSYLQVCDYKVEATAVGAALMYITPFIRDF